MSYLYLTPGLYLSTAKIKRFKSLDNNWVYLPDDDVEYNAMSKQIVIDFYHDLCKKELYPIIRPLDGQTNIEYEQKEFLKKIGLTESFINSEHSTIYTKYMQYYTRMKKTYDIFMYSIKDIPTETEESKKHSYSIVHVGNHYGVVDNDDIICHCDTYREAEETIAEMEDE